MLVQAVVYYIGLPYELAIPFVLACIAFSVLCLGFGAAFYLDGAQKKPKPVPRGVDRISGVPPADQYIIPATGPCCGGKDCELMGCAIIGSCQRKRA